MKPSLRNKLSVLVQRRLMVERRNGKRLTPQHRTLCLLQLSGGERAVGYVHNLSYKGVAISAERDYSLGSSLNILLVNEAHTFSLALQMKVVRCVRLGSSQYLVAGPFDRSLRHDELVPFIV